MTEMEELFVPYNAEKRIGGECVLVFAPHPDDEVFGCGGAIMRHVMDNNKVRVVVVTDGGYPVTDSVEPQDYRSIAGSAHSSALSLKKEKYGILAERFSFINGACSILSYRPK